MGFSDLLATVISPVRQRHQWQPIFQETKMRLSLALMIIGTVTVLVGLAGLFVSPGVQRRGAEMQRLQDDYRADKIKWQQYQEGARRAKK